MGADRKHVRLLSLAQSNIGSGDQDRNYSVLPGASMGVEDWSMIKHLTKDQINHLILNYRGPGSREELVLAFGNS